LFGEKNGEITGKLYFIVQKNVQIKKTLDQLNQTRVFKNYNYLLWPKSLRSIINKLIKSKYSVKAPITAFLEDTSEESLS